jgi:hypothetical protein
MEVEVEAHLLVLPEAEAEVLLIIIQRSFEMWLFSQERE